MKLSMKNASEKYSQENTRRQEKKGTLGEREFGPNAISATVSNNMGELWNVVASGVVPSRVRSKDPHNDQSLDEGCLWKRGYDPGEEASPSIAFFRIRTALSVTGGVSISVLMRKLGSSSSSHYIICLFKYLKMRILGQVWESAFLARSQVMQCCWFVITRSWLCSSNALKLAIEPRLFGYESLWSYHFVALLLREILTTKILILKN